eukprot:3490816-Pleurochrysis_carterae.AAC.1
MNAYFDEPYSHHHRPPTESIACKRVNACTYTIANVEQACIIERLPGSAFSARHLQGFGKACGNGYPRVLQTSTLNVNLFLGNVCLGQVGACKRDHKGPRYSSYMRRYFSSANCICVKWVKMDK